MSGATRQTGQSDKPRRAMVRRSRLTMRRAMRRIRRLRRRLLGPIAAALEAIEPKTAPSTLIVSELPSPRRSYRVLVPVARPDTAARLAMMAAGVAEARDGEVIVVTVVRSGDPAAIETNAGAVMERTPAVRIALDVLAEAGVQSGFVVRVSEDIGRTLRREARRQRADLVILGWGEPASGFRDRIGDDEWDAVVEAERTALPVSLRAMVEYPPADVLVVAGGGAGDPMRIVVPVGIGGESMKAVRLADRLARRSDGGELTLLRVIPESASPKDVEQRTAALREAIDELSIDAKVRVVRSDGLADRIVRSVREDGFDTVVAASMHETLARSRLLGGIQLRLARECDVPVLVLHRRAGELTYVVRRIWKRLYALTPTLSPGEQEIVEAEIRDDAVPDMDFLVMIGLAALIAAFGLLLNSAAVIIGAMLVAPLMAAIIAVGLGVVEGELDLIRRGLIASLRGAALAIFVGAVAGLVYTGSRTDLPIEIMSRTRPQLLDLGVAVASGAAAAYALGRRSVSASLPGVAIAAALVPPLSVVGIGVATRRPDVAFGALLLFITNFIAIVAAGGLTFMLLGFGPTGEEVEERAVLRRGMRTAGGLLLVVALLLGGITLDLVRDSSIDRRIADAFEQVESSEEFTQFHPFEVVDYGYVETDDGTLQISAVIRLRAELLTNFTYRVARSIQDQLGASLDRSVALNVEIVPTRILTAREPPTSTPTSTMTPSATPTQIPTLIPTLTSTVTPSATSTLTAPSTAAADVDGTPSDGTPANGATPSIGGTPAGEASPGTLEEETP